MKILAFGEVLWDIYPDKKFIGGAPLNFAAHLVKHGEEAYMLSAVGDDDLGEETLYAVKKLGVGTKYISVLNNIPTGRCDVTLDNNAVPSYDLKSNVAYDYINFENISEDFDVLYFGTLANRSEFNFTSLTRLLADKRFKEIFCDVNIRAPFYDVDTVKLCFKKATIIKISSEEMSVVCNLLNLPVTGYEEFAKTVSSLYTNLKIIIITLGENGAICYDCASDSLFKCSAHKVRVVSTVGAGDSFSAAFLHKYMKKYDLSSCLEHASRVSGFVVANKSAVPDYDLKFI